MSGKYACGMQRSIVCKFPHYRFDVKVFPASTAVGYEGRTACHVSNRRMNCSAQCNEIYCQYAYDAACSMMLPTWQSTEWGCNLQCKALALPVLLPPPQPLWLAALYSMQSKQPACKMSDLMPSNSKVS
jgi:hypothetical protein